MKIMIKTEINKGQDSIHRYGGVRILNTFDSTGNIETHIERVITNRNPHFNGAGDDNEHDCTHV